MKDLEVDSPPLENEASEQHHRNPLDQATTNASSTKKQKSNKGKAPADLRRSLSTPHMRGFPASETDLSSPTTEKRRNKLGYHRTSVACGHCRRRKIRCLLAPNDPQGRCSNCIRLKKECNFYPVEQQHPSVLRPQVTPKREVLSSAQPNSTPTSPRPSSTIGYDRIDDFSSYSQLKEVDSHGLSLPSSEETSLHHSIYPFPAPLDHQSWAQAQLNHPTSAPRESPENMSPTGYWSPNQPVTSHSFSNMSKQAVIQPASALNANQIFSFAHPGEAHGWMPPTRSMSYGQVEGLSHSYPMHHPNPELVRSRPSPFPHTPALDTSSSSVTTLASLGQPSGALSAPAGASVISPYDYQSGWVPYGGQSQSSHIPTQSPMSFGSQWYPDPSQQLEKVDEEQLSSVPYHYYQDPHPHG
ncbi:hypothetical protein M501DRAFT_932757 [Patellaria atrata CBS 101060]|uniref:Zn(2)-C6 fungal-type domain-containing protein n=1 Tax=Patellaria atrata CBS 101060 TaxID=1346257 RepID=A0A9P4SBV1_9PEZI|nr:hypothetical protein M501DRAFT_932757 [Patellaria atrata CBS 101060]